MAEAVVMIETLSIVANLSSNEVTEHTCYVNETILKFLPKLWVSA